MKETLLFLKSSDGVKNAGGEDTDITFTLSPTLAVPRKQIGIQVDTVEFPISWQNVNSTNKRITFTISGSSSINYDLDEGQYTAQSLATAITALIPTLTVSYSELTNRLTLTNTTANWTIEGSSFRLLGLETSAGLTSPTLTVVAPNVVNLIQRNFCEIKVVEINGISTDYNMAKLPLDGDILTYTYMANTNPIRYIYPSPTDTFSTIRISIRASDGSYFNLRGIPWSISLRATT
jgi:hypothetical protein